jgi:hypothetical protein
MPSKHPGNDEGHFNDGDADREYQGTKRFTSFMGNYFGVMYCREDSANQHDAHEGNKPSLAKQVCHRSNKSYPVKFRVSLRKLIKLV